MGPLSRPSLAPYSDLQIDQLSVTSTNTRDTILAIEPILSCTNQSESKQICGDCPQEILSPKNISDDRAENQEQRISNISTETIAQTFPLPELVDDSSVVDDPAFGDDYDVDCQLLKYAVAAGTAMIGLTLLNLGSRGDSI